MSQIIEVACCNHLLCPQVSRLNVAVFTKASACLCLRTQIVWLDDQLQASPEAPRVGLKPKPERCSTHQSLELAFTRVESCLDRMSPKPLNHTIRALLERVQSHYPLKGEYVLALPTARISKPLGCLLAFAAARISKATAKQGESQSLEILHRTRRWSRHLFSKIFRSLSQVCTLL